MRRQDNHRTLSFVNDPPGVRGRGPRVVLGSDNTIVEIQATREVSSWYEYMSRYRRIIISDGSASPGSFARCGNDPPKALVNRIAYRWATRDQHHTSFEHLDDRSGSLRAVAVWAGPTRPSSRASRRGLGAIVISHHATYMCSAGWTSKKGCAVIAPRATDPLLPPSRRWRRLYDERPDAAGRAWKAF